MNPTNDEIQTKGGIILPPSAETQHLIIQKRLQEEADKQVHEMIEWAKSWPRGGQPPLKKLDIQETCLALARVHRWTPEYMVHVYNRVIDGLGLNPPLSEKEQREAARRQRRIEKYSKLTVVPPEDPYNEHPNPYNEDPGLGNLYTGQPQEPQP